MAGNWPLFVGLSHGDGFVASVIGQPYNNEIRILASFSTEGMSLRRHLSEYAKPWLSANGRPLRMIGAYEDFKEPKVRAETDETIREILGGEWASIWKPWDVRRDAMLDALTKAVPFTFKPVVQLDGAGALVLSQALSSGRYNPRVEADKRNYHLVDALSLLLARLELWKAMPKPSEPRVARSWMSV